MENRQENKRVKVMGRDFVIHKFTPFFGVYLVVNTFGGIVGKGDKLKAMVDSIMGKPRDEFIKLQADILKHCSEVLPAGNTPVVNDEGNFAVMNMTAPLALNLLIQTLLFSMTDFFTEGVMEELEKSVKEGLGAFLKSPQKT